MTITVATVSKPQILTHRPYTDKNGDRVFMQRFSYHFEDDLDNSYTYRGIDAPANHDEQAFLIPLGRSWERGNKERAIREDEEAKAATRLAIKEQAVEDEKQAIDDAVDARLALSIR